MRIRLVLALAALIALAVPAATVAGAVATSTATLRSVHVTVPLPGPGQSRLEVLTIAATAKKGGVGSLGVRSLNDAQVPAAIRAIAIITPRSSGKRRATFTVYIGLNNLSGLRSGRAAGGTTAEDIEIYFAHKSFHGLGLRTVGTRDWHFPTDCAEAVDVGNKVEGPNAARYAFVRLRPQREQPSAPEEILDHIVYNGKGCAAKGAEVPEPGNG